MSNQVDEREVEPDYFIDRAPHAEFIPRVEGVDKAINLSNGDLFDFNLEAQPLLQVLCGRALEQGLIEVKEEHENLTLAKHTQQFRQLRESELLETQRMEAHAVRKQDEMERRNLQVRTHGMVQEETEKRVMCRLEAKSFLKYFKRDCLAQLLDLGVLRSAADLSMGTHFVPHLLGQAEYDLRRAQGGEAEFEGLIQASGDKIAKRHKDSIAKEMRRRHDAIQAEKKRVRDEAEAKRQRKLRRNALREAYKLVKMRELINEELVVPAPRQDYSPAVRVSDVRDYNPEAPAGVYVMGGFAAELMLTFTALYEWI